MPTEHEFKYVISLDIQKVFIAPEKYQDIWQGYLAFSKGMTTRIRKLVDNNKESWFLTFKQKVANRVIEIEKKLDDRDGNDLWSVCVGKLKKRRYICDNKGVKWEIDFFLNGSQVYFILAEVELPEGSERPKKAPSIIRDYVLYEVPLTDDSFSNKRLADVEYATKAYSEILKRQRHEQVISNSI